MWSHITHIQTCGRPSIIALQKKCFLLLWPGDLDLQLDQPFNVTFRVDGTSWSHEIQKGDTDCVPEDGTRRFLCYGECEWCHHIPCFIDSGMQ